MGPTTKGTSSEATHMKNRMADQDLWHTGPLIDGEWLTETDYNTLTVTNPATGGVLAELATCGVEETTSAVESAQRAFLQWRTTTAKQRAGVLRGWYELMLQHRDDLATIVTAEEGKPWAEAKGEVDYAASFIEWFAEEAKRAYGDLIPAPRGGQRILAVREPIGVCAAITPWNFPVAMITRKAGPALAAGCTMVVKPASQTPLSALAIADLALRAGVPAGALNVVVGRGGVVGGVLTGHNLVRKVTFTGSTATGRQLMAQSASTVKKCSMELGGNAPFVVFEDADVDAAVEGVMVAKFRNTGQSCIGANRVLVQNGVYDEFVCKVVERVRQLKVGSGFDDDVKIGPLIDENAVHKVLEHVNDAVTKGAKVLVGGSRSLLGTHFFEPTVLGEVGTDAMLARDETFGPLLPVFRFASDEDAVAMANNTEYGLAAYLYSRDASRIWRVAEALETGMVGINCGLISTEVAPFGGVKQSGLGREGSRYGLEEFQEIKYLAWDGIGLPLR